MKKLVILFLLLIGTSAFSMSDSLLQRNWFYLGVAVLNISQIALNNWTQAGDNALAFTLLGNFGAKYVDSPWTFNNGLKLAFGRTKFGEDEFRTNDNEFYLESILSLSLEWALDPYISNTVRTVISNGFDYKAAPAIQTTQFFDPGYITQSIGFMYHKIPNVTTRLGIGFQETITSKFPSYSDDPKTAKIEKFKFDTGIESVTEALYNIEVEDNVLFGSKLRLFCRFNELDVWDVRWDNLLTV